MIHAAMQHAMRSPLQSAMDRIGSAVWTPATLFAASEQGVWYDPSDFSTMFQDSAGTTPVTAVGQPVGRILDKSGRGNHATQVTAAARPVLQQDGNGKYYLAFDGVDDGMVTAAINFTATDKMSVFAGIRKLGSAGEQDVVEHGVPGVNSNSPTLLSAPSNMGGDTISSVLRPYGGIAVGPYVSPITFVSASTLDAAAGGTGATNVQIRINGVLPTQTANASTAGTAALGSYPLYIGRRGGTSNAFDGRIYQLIIRGALTDAAGITAAEAFVNSKTAAY